MKIRLGDDVNLYQKSFLKKINGKEKKQKKNGTNVLENTRIPKVMDTPNNRKLQNGKIVES